VFEGYDGSSVEERLWEKRYGGGGTQSGDETGTGGGSMKYVGVDSDSDSGCRSCVTCSREDEATCIGRGASTVCIEDCDGFSFAAGNLIMSFENGGMFSFMTICAFLAKTRQVIDKGGKRRQRLHTFIHGSCCSRFLCSQSLCILNPGIIMFIKLLQQLNKRVAIIMKKFPILHKSV
jgi:hypothetical protein